MAGGKSARGRRWFFVALAIVGVVIIGAVAWVGVRAMLVKAEFDAALPVVSDIRKAALKGDLATVEELTPALAERADAAASLSGDPIWRVAEFTPWAGPNLTAVRVVAAELERVTGVLPTLLSSIGDISDGDSPGIVDVAALAAAAGPLEDAASSMADASDELGAIDTSALIGPVAKGTEQMQEAMALIVPAVGAAADIARTVPPTLGAEEPRSVLLMLQNSAELRTGGGITGTFIELRAEDGTLTLVQQADSKAFASRPTPIAPVPESTTTLYSDEVGRFVQNASMPADFGTTAELVSAWWQGLTGRTPDTIVSIDPFVLRALVSVIGPVELAGGGTLDKENFVQKVLVEPYMNLDSKEQSTLFAAAVESVFARVTEGGLDPVALAKAMSTPVSEGRISIWSAHPAENEVFSASVMGGPAVRQSLAGSGAFAVHFNDVTGGKLADFLDVSMAADVVDCRTDGLADVAVTVTVTSTAPADLASWPFAMTGGGYYGIPAGDIGTNISVAAPADGFLGGVSIDGEPYAGVSATDAGFPTAAAQVILSPGESSTVEYLFTVPAEDAQSMQLLHTPLMNEPAITVTPDCG